MENQVNNQAAPSVYDYRQYDRIWRRVSPELDPYPEIRAEADRTHQAVPANQTAQATRRRRAGRRSGEPAGRGRKPLLYGDAGPGVPGGA